MAMPDEMPEWSKEGFELNWEGCVELYPQKAEAMRRDNHEPKPHTHRMTDITREELNARLEAADAKVDARLASFESTVRETLAAIRQDSAEVRGELKAMHVELSSLKNIKGSIWAAAGATILGLSGIVATMLSFGVASYDTARENTVLVSESKEKIVESQKKVDEALASMSSQLAESRRQAEETRKLLEQIKNNASQSPDQSSQQRNNTKPRP